jgi:hypothetical protein
MKNVLKVWLKRRRLYNNPNSFYAQVCVSNSLSISDIIDEIINEGVVDNRECAIEFMNHFNRKAAELLMNGNNIDTGLVKMSPQTNGYIQEKLWNPANNSVGASFSEGSDLLKVIKETTIEIIGADEEIPVHPDYMDQPDSMNKDNIGRNAELNGSYRKTGNDNTPPCGIAFRNWILKG